MDCIETILSFYKSKDQRSSEMINDWVCNLLINLMNDLDRCSPNLNLKIRNCLILLINLFFNVDYPDQFETIGKSTLELKNDEKKTYFELLKAEFININ